MESGKKKELIDYWKKTAEHDYETMLVLFKAKRYSDSLFFGHVVLEKIIKALIVKKTGENAPYIHDLLRLAILAGLKSNKQTEELLDKVNDFNIRARYPEKKLSFYKEYKKSNTEMTLKRIISLYKKLCQQIRPNK